MASGLDESQRGMPQDDDPESDKAVEGEDCVEVNKPDRDWDEAIEDEDGVEVKKPDPDWDEALENEDCVAVMKLLRKNNERLVRGWNSDDKSLKGEGDVLEKLLNEGSKADVKASQKLKGKNEGSKQEKASQKLKGKNQRLKKDVKAWQALKVRLTGRTALHVAARRGDLKLLEFMVSDILHVGGKCLAQYSCHVLEVIDSDYKLDALAMAVASGNPEIINLLMKTSRDCEFNPYHVAAPSKEPIRDREVNPYRFAALFAAPSEEKEHTEDAPSEQDPDKILKGITKDALEKSPWPLVVKDLYARDCDFNFNPLEKFNLHIFHFTFSTWVSDETSDPAIKPIRDEIFCVVSKHLQSKILLKYLFLDLKDGQGRTPLHVAVDSNKVMEFCKLLHDGSNRGSIDGKLIEDILNAEDDAGRTPLYRAAAKNQLVAVSELLKEDSVNVNAKITYKADQWGTCVDLARDLDKLSWKNGFKSDCVYAPAENLRMKDSSQSGSGLRKILPAVSSTALHVAIILKHEEIVKSIVKSIVDKLKSSKDGKDVACCRQFTSPTGAWKESTSSYALYQMSTMKLAVLAGSIGIVQTLLKAEELRPRLFSSAVQDENDLSAFHLAAVVGKPGIVKMFLDSTSRDFDPTAGDCFGHTALHHALKGKYATLQPHLVDFVGCHHVRNYDDWKSELPAKSRDLRSNVESNENAKGEGRYGQRIGSINLLLEAGISIWEKNEIDRTACPGPDASEDFVKWWYEKVAVETHEAQKKLNDAANAISVTATLVATASYLGPLQPPLGYEDSSLQANILPVRIFVVCDSLSFYLALGAIMLSLFPALPLPHDSMFREQVRRRIYVAVAVAFFLFPSIIFLLLAFATSYIAAIPEHGLAYHGLTVTTTVVGGVLCLLAMIGFSSRLATLLTTTPKEVRKQIRRFLKEIFLIKKFFDLVNQFREVAAFGCWLAHEFRREVYRQFFVMMSIS